MQTKFAVGIDIIEIDRVADVISRHGDRFLNRASHIGRNRPLPGTRL